MNDELFHSLTPNFMQIEELFIADGVIQEYTLEGQTLTMMFQDYDKSTLEMVISGCHYLSVKGTLGFSLSRGKFTKSKEGEVWCFFDDDGFSMEVRLTSYVMRRVE